MKKRFGGILVLLIFFGIVLSYLGYFDKPEDRVNSFLDAYNRQDLTGMMDMIDNPEVDKLGNALGLTGTISEALLGVNVADLLVDFMPLSEDLMGYEGSRMFAKINSVDMDLLRTEAKVYADVTAKFENESEQESLVFYLKKKDRNWYITDVQ